MTAKLCKCPIATLIAFHFVLSSALILSVLGAEEKPSLATAGRPVKKDEVGRLSVQEVRERLPKTLMTNVSSRESQLRSKLFQRLGALRGEQAIGEIIIRYRDPQSAMQEVVRAIENAIVGWMSTDVDKASIGLLKFAEGVRYEVEEHSRTRVFWKGRSLELQGDFGILPVWSLINSAVCAATEANPQSGLALLRRREMLVGNAPPESVLDSYIQGLDQDTDWLAVKRQLDEVELLKERSRSLEYDAAALAVAPGWAQSDLTSAMAWYVSQTEHTDKGEADLAHRLLWRFAGRRATSKRRQVVDWFQSEKGKSIATDELLSEYVIRLRHWEPDDAVKRLIALPSDETTREQIRSSWVNMKAFEGGPRHASASLNALITAANLSQERESHWLSVIKEQEQLNHRKD